MELRQLKSFERIASLGGFGKAAHALGLAQPTLSYQMHDLEEEAGIVLFDRKTKPIQLTIEGEAVLRRVRDVLNSVELLQNEMSDLAALHRGNLVVGVSQTLAPLLPELIARFSERYPEIEVTLREGSIPTILGEAAAADLDVALVARGLVGAKIPSGLDTTVLAAFEYTFVAPPDHPLAGRRNVTLAELANLRLVLTTGSLGQAIGTAMADKGLPPRDVFRTNDASMMLELVGKGMGIGLAPDFRVLRSPVAVATFGSADLPLGDELLLVSPRRSQHGLERRRFVDFAVSWDWERELSSSGR